MSALAKRRVSATSSIWAAARDCWRSPPSSCGARGRASDIDVVAVAVARENAVANGVVAAPAHDRCRRLDNPALAEGAPYDLIVAKFSPAPSPGSRRPFRAHWAAGVLILSGLLPWQENLVLSFYRPHGLVLRNAAATVPGRRFCLRGRTAALTYPMDKPYQVLTTSPTQRPARPDGCPSLRTRQTRPRRLYRAPRG